MEKTSIGKRKSIHEILILGILFVAMAINLAIPTLFATQSQLVEITGLVNDINQTIQTGGGHSRLSPLDDGLYHTASITFTLKNQPQYFSISESIGSNTKDQPYNYIYKSLKSANEVSVWIRSRDSDEPHPKVYRIDANQITLLPLNSTRYNKLWGIVSLFLFGITAIIVWAWFFYRRQ